ncbi:hypothetical protein TNIN_139581 [Trichonephila inaurata madagascariensis]|uniref:Uncharacterized protein n=1 Tax=Trichonephila inaurata madagascariensis TaxID=2747483 RepID=A0A8X7C1C4_9ARAC|nr:hypothetical protein TNIN_139581 [Trichonephila inaurata madagascariensis]
MKRDDQNNGSTLACGRVIALASPVTRHSPTVMELIVSPPFYYPESLKDGWVKSPHNPSKASEGTFSNPRRLGNVRRQLEISLFLSSCSFKKDLPSRKRR